MMGLQGTKSKQRRLINGGYILVLFFFNKIIFLLEWCLFILVKGSIDLHTYKSEYILSTKKFLTLNFMFKLNGCALAAIKKRKILEGRLNSKTIKKRGTEGEVRYRPRR
jgi:hypothetical protein